MRVFSNLVRPLILFAVLALPAVHPAGVLADDTPLEFKDPALERRYQELLGELRCLVCQNQTLADSHADLAQDLREEIHARLEQGHSNDEIVEFLVARYGDFVRYRPALSTGTLLLWLGPFLLLAAAFVILFRVARQRRAAAATLTAAEQARVRSLLEDPDRH